ncbi:hypothetical protein Tco_1211729 [Tanacetum coccineum]
MDVSQQCHHPEKRNNSNDEILKNWQCGGVAFGGDVAAGSGSRGGGDDEDSGCGVDWVDQSGVVVYGVGGGSPEVA